MAGRTVEDRLREEYFDPLPDARRVLEELEEHTFDSQRPLPAFGSLLFPEAAGSNRIISCAAGSHPALPIRFRQTKAAGNRWHWFRLKDLSRI